MTSPGEPGAKISTTSRVLAGIVLFCAVLGVAGWVVMTFKSGQSDWGGALLAILLIGLASPLFWFAAWKGRSPRWLSSIETMYDREAARRGIPTTATNSGRGLMFGVTTVVFGLLLIALGQSLELFDSETGWFAAAAFFVAWLAVVLILWRNARKTASRP